MDDMRSILQKIDTVIGPIARLLDARLDKDRGVTIHMTASTAKDISEAGSYLQQVLTTTQWNGAPCAAAPKMPSPDEIANILQRQRYMNSQRMIHGEMKATTEAADRESAKAIVEYFNSLVSTGS